MAEEERAPLVSSGEFRDISQRSPRAVCGCPPWCARVPILSSFFRKKEPHEEGTFSSSIGVLLSMMGCVVGTGNIWRYPRIVANNAGEGGALAFLIVWAFFLSLWSIPIILIEYGVGRFTRKSVIESFATLLGPSYRFMGGFQVIVGLCIGSYYSVLLGWCGYYFIITCAHPLPESYPISNSTFYELQDSNWPVLCHGLAMLLATLSVSRGVSTIEPVNKVVVPILLFIIVFCFYWALFLPYAADGIIHMFSPSWDSFKSSRLWLDAISQNAWDTGAGLGLFLTYATYMKRSQGAVKLGTITPFFNNVVSLLCGLLVFCTVFSVQIQEGKTKEEVIGVLKENGPANTGLTFIWMPILFRSLQVGQFLCAIFFLCITLAGLSSLISLVELPVHALADFGIQRIPATILVGVVMFSIGLASAFDVNILVNQDGVWAYAMILSGCLLLFLVIRYGPLRFRRALFNDYGIGDWPLPLVWVIVVLSIAPIEGAVLIVWWVVEEIINHNATWWQFSTESLAMVLSQWAVAILIALGLNWWLAPLKISPPASPFWRKVLRHLVKFTDPPPPYSEVSKESEIAMATKEVEGTYGSTEHKGSVIIKDVEL